MAFLVLPDATSVEAQSANTVVRPDSPWETDHWLAPRWMGDVAFVAANAVLAGVTAGITRKVRGGGFREAFAAGAAGGAVAYAGRRVGASRFDGAGLLGRQISAVGVSVGRNAGDGRPALERLLFPLGPVHLYVDRASGLTIHPKIHVVGLAQAARLALSPETRFDGPASFSAGAPVFRAPDRTLIVEGTRASGLALHGSIVLGASDDPERLFAHERVHIIQSDYAFLAWSEPVEGWLLERNRYTAAIARYMDFGVLAPVLAVGAMRLTGAKLSDWPHEHEARFLAER